ncbi:hypothetical protein B566_EDAN013619, partial [Ephemera danica]
MMMMMMNGIILQEVLKRNLPQDVLQSLFATLLQASDWKLTQIRLYCEARSELTQMYIHNETSFPLLFVAKKFINRYNMVKLNERSIHNEDECIKRMSLLLKHGADINARYLDEPTPVHLAAKRDAWEVVKMLLTYQANIDIEIGGITTRKIITREKPELIEDYEIQCENKSTKEKLYDALYEEDEEEFLKLLFENENYDVNNHNGKETFLQLSIIKQFERSTEILLQRRADINLVAGLGIEPILLAFKNPGLECMTQLSSYTCLMKNRISHNSGTILHELDTITLENVEKHRELVECIVDDAVNQNVNLYAVDKNHLTALQRLDNLGPKGHILMCILLRFMVPHFQKIILEITPPQVFEQFFNERVQYDSNKRSDIDGIRVNYDFMRPENLEEDQIIPEMGLFYEMSKIPEYADTVLLHPLVKLFLVYKWRKIAFVFIFNFILYALFTLFLSIHVYHFVLPENRTEVSQGNLTQTIIQKPREFDVWHIIGIIFWTIIFFREVFQLIISCFHYLKSLENLLEILLLTFSLLTYIPTFEDSNFIMAMAIILAYLELTLLIGRYPSKIGIYVTMFTRVTFKSSKVVLTFAAFIFSFAFSFFIMFQDAEIVKTVDDNLWNMIFRTAGMAIGELNLSDLINFSTFGGQIILLMFAFLITIVFMNLLNALAISDTQSIIDETEAMCCVANINQYTKIEAIFLRYDPENLNIQDYCKRNIDRNRLFRYLNSFFSINVLPIIHSQSTGMRNVMKIEVHGDRFSPLLYKAPNKPIQHCGQNVYSRLRYIYSRILLHSDEDTILNQILTNKKYPVSNKDNTFFANKLHKGILHQQENLLSLKKQNKKWQRKILNQMNEQFAEIQNKLMTKQEHEMVNLIIALQEQVSELRKDVEQISQ